MMVGKRNWDSQRQKVVAGDVLGTGAAHDERPKLWLGEHNSRGEEYRCRALRTLWPDSINAVAPRHGRRLSQHSDRFCGGSMNPCHEEIVCGDAPLVPPV